MQTPFLRIAVIVAVVFIYQVNAAPVERDMHASGTGIRMRDDRLLPFLPVGRSLRGPAEGAAGIESRVHAVVGAGVFKFTAPGDTANVYGREHEDGLVRRGNPSDESKTEAFSAKAAKSAPAPISSISTSSI